MQELTLIILAGGRSSRMKREKAFLKIKKERLIDRMVGEGKDFFNEVIVVTNEMEKYKYLDAQVISDLIPRQGPLAGIHAGLIKASFPFSFVIACDMPFASMKLGLTLAKEAKNYDVVVPLLERGLQPLQAIYSKNCVPVIEKHLRANQRKTTDIYSDLKVKTIPEKDLDKWGFDRKIFLNINTPQEYEELLMMVKEQKNDLKTNS